VRTHAWNGAQQGSRVHTQLWEVGLLLDCGHVSCCFDQEVPPGKADDYIWTCDECGAEDQEVRRVLGAVPDKDLDRMTEEEFIVVLSGAS
jgi:hypothetical protein